MTGYDAHGAVEFKLDDRSYRMISLANSGDYMYRRCSLSIELNRCVCVCVCVCVCLSKTMHTHTRILCAYA